MKIKRLIISAVAIAVLLTGLTSRAENLHRVFNDSAEAGMMRDAYDILATGDHDYDGHRVKAMRSIEMAAKRLGVILRGDDKDRPRQALSDEKLREAQGLLQNVVGAAEVKNQRRVVWRINEAVGEINTALTIR